MTKEAIARADYILYVMGGIKKTAQDRYTDLANQFEDIVSKMRAFNDAAQAEESIARPEKQEVYRIYSFLWNESQKAQNEKTLKAVLDNIYDDFKNLLSNISDRYIQDSSNTGLEKVFSAAKRVGTDLNAFYQLYASASRNDFLISLGKKKGKKKKKKSGGSKSGFEPTNKDLWNRAKAAARNKFDVYPSAYANLWASKWYKDKGGGWRKKKKKKS